MPVKGNASGAVFTGIRHPSAASIRHAGCQIPDAGERQRPAVFTGIGHPSEASIRHPFLSGIRFSVVFVAALLGAEVDQLAVNSLGETDGRGDVDAADGVLLQFAALLDDRGLAGRGLGRSRGAPDPLKDTAEQGPHQGEEQNRQQNFEDEESKHLFTQYPYRSRQNGAGRNRDVPPPVRTGYFFFFCAGAFGFL
jgi:hypothetical protein